MNHDGVFAPTVVTSQALVDSSLHTFESRTDIAVDPVWMDEASHGKAKLRLLVIDGMVRRPSSWYFSYLNVCAIELTDGELKVPVATPPNAIVFGSGYLTIPQMARAGFVLNVVGAFWITFITYILVIPLFGMLAVSP